MELVINSKIHGEHIVLFDDCYAPIICKYSWHLIPADSSNGNFYAAVTVGKTTFRMHNFIHPQWKMIDHINSNGLDNRDINLRLTTPKTNAFNRNKRKNFKGKYKGVELRRAPGVWWAFIGKNYKRYCLGRFSDEDAAALAYNHAATELHGEFAKLNIVNVPDNFNYKDYELKHTSDYPFVSFDKSRGLWAARANIGVRGKRKYIHLGRFKTELEAHNAVCKKIEEIGK